MKIDELLVGSKAPAFTLEDAKEKNVKLSDFEGKTILLYFYSKNDTPGCTSQACDFQEQEHTLKDKGIQVIGISPDSAESHAKFKSKYGLNFILLSDSEKKVATAYGAYGEKMMYGKKTIGIIRSTLVIDGNGIITKIYRNVKAKGHVERILKDICNG
jgi:thioredoxin-dependent peroxiredoxin